MRKEILFIILLFVALIFLVCKLCFADFIPPPPPLQKVPVELQQYLRKVSDNFNNLEVITSAPNGSKYGKKGDVVLYNNAGTFTLWVNTTGTPTTPLTVWQQI